MIFCIISCMYIVQGQGKTANGGQFFFFYGSIKVLSLWSLVACLKNKTFALLVHAHFVMILIHVHVYSPGKCRQPIGANILMSTKRPYHFGHLLQVSKKSLWTLILCTFVHAFIHVYSPAAGVHNPWGTKFCCQQKYLITSPICYKFKNKISLNSDFIHIFSCFLYMYIAPGLGHTTFWGHNFDVNRNLLSLWSFFASFFH